MGFIRNTLCAILLAAGFVGCNSKFKEVYVENVDNVKVVVYEQEKNIFSTVSSPRKVFIHDKSGNISRVLFDADGQGFGGKGDCIEIHHPDGNISKFEYYKFTDKEGKRYSFAFQDDPFRKALFEKYQEEVKQSNELYERVLKAVVEAKTK